MCASLFMKEFACTELPIVKPALKKLQQYQLPAIRPFLEHRLLLHVAGSRYVQGAIGSNRRR
jgi:hypothetical protein